MRDRSEEEKQEDALVLGSMLETGRGTVLLVEERAGLREQIALRLLNAGYRVVVGRAARAVAREAVGRDVVAVVAAAAGLSVPGSPFEALEVVRYGAPLVVLVTGGETTAPAGLPADTRIVRTEGPIAGVEPIVVEALEAAVEEVVARNAAALSSGISRRGVR